MLGRFQSDGVGPRRIPRSWADHAPRQTPTEDELEAHAIRVRTGQVNVIVPGNRTDPADHHWRPGLQVLYVTDDAAHAIELVTRCDRVDNTTYPPDDFHAVRTYPPSKLHPVPNDRWPHYRRDLEHLYDIHTRHHLDTDDFQTATDLASDGGDGA